MLCSISPLGERARGNRWPVTATAYLIGSATAGTGLGAALGGVGGLFGRAAVPRLAAAAVLAAGGAAVDLVGRLPSVRRQVNEDWLHRYRGWVYGLGFGGQLGFGLVTVVTSAATYLTFALALLAGSWAPGALIGGVFGLVRAVPLLSLRRVYSPAQLRHRHRQLQGWAAAAGRLTVLGQAAAGIGLAAAAVVVTR